MKPRHAVALALLGWYLMVPPQSLVKLDLSGLSAKSPEIEVDRRVDEALERADALPLSRWQMQGSYDTAKECKDQVDYDNENNSAIPNMLLQSASRPMIRASKAIRIMTPRHAATVAPIGW
jgi:hypothetical protein